MIKKILLTLTLVSLICLNANAQMPLIGDTAPAFTAVTTQGKINFPKDYAGKWVILFSHPADFTPVCTTEFITFQRMICDFKALNTEVIGLSIDNVNDHIKWLKSIEEFSYQGVPNQKITFPLIADPCMKIAKKYGMIQPNASTTKTVRAVFFIDPCAKVRAILYYPLTTGRNMGEIKRLLIAMQTFDAFGAKTPANWCPGDDVIVKSEQEEKAKETMPSMEKTCYTSYLCTIKLSKEALMEKLLKK